MIVEALRAMEAVAEHINEMQKIYEEYGCYFEEIVRVNKESRRGKVDLLYYLFLEKELNIVVCCQLKRKQQS